MLLTIACTLGLVLAQSETKFADIASRAAAAREASQLSQAMELYRQAVMLNPKWEEGWWFLGSLSYDANQFVQGREALRQVVQMDPKAEPAWALLGLCEFETRNYAASLEHIQRALDTKPAEPQMETVLRFHEAMLLTRAGRFDKAIEKYGWFAKKGIRNPNLIVAMGLAVLRNPLLPAEVTQDQRLILSAGEAAYFTLAGDYRDARPAFESLLENYPQAHYVHYAYGCYLLGIDPNLAIQQLRAELELTPASAAANSMIAFALLERGESDEALPFAKNAVEEQPNFELAQYVLGRTLSEKGDPAGIEHLEKAEKLDPTDLQAHISLATAYSRAGRPQKAREERKKSIELATGNSAVADH